MRIDADWLAAAPTQGVLGMLTEAGHQAFAVGGCVRNTLIGFPVSDIDIATSASPEQVTELAGQAGYRAVPTGVEHGTVTVVADGRPLEVTTFRRDVETDGRRAVVAFTDKLEEDARRRDFTINALYVDAEGDVHDPLGGLDDIGARRVRFVGDPAARIREDYLRSLRFFRFHAWYADPGGGFDAEALSAIAENLDGVERLASERIGAEMKKLLAAPDPAPALAAMQSVGLLAVVLPGADPGLIAPLVALESGAQQAADPIRRLAALGGEDPATRLRLSRAEARSLGILTQETAGSAGLAEIAWRHGAATAWNVCLLRHTIAARPIPEAAAAEIARGAAATFPVKARDLLPELEGPELGRMLKRLERDWIDSDFRLDRVDLLARAGVQG